MPVFLPEKSPQDGVDESGLGIESELAGRGNRFVDGCVVRDAIHERQLVKSESQHIAGACFSWRLIRFFIDPGVEQHQVARHAVNHFLNQVAVNCFELGTGERLAHDVFRKSGA